MRLERDLLEKRGERPNEDENENGEDIGGSPILHPPQSHQILSFFWNKLLHFLLPTFILFNLVCPSLSLSYSADTVPLIQANCPPLSSLLESLFMFFSLFN